MSQRRLGIAAGRRGLSAVGLERSGREYALRGQWRVARASGESVTTALERLRESIPDDWRTASVHLALSPVSLACADLLEVPYRNENQILRVAGSLAEGRCAGETVEELAIDTLVTGRSGEGSRIQLGAMRSASLKDLKATLSRLLPKASVELITAIPFALSRALPDGDGLWGVSLGALGEGAVWERKGGDVRHIRVFPMESQGRGGLHLLERNARSLNSTSAELQVLDGPAPVRGVTAEGIAPEELAAVGVALLDPQRSLNLLRGAADAPRSVLDHVHSPLLASAVAATVLFVAVGLYFDLCARQHEADLARCHELEQAAWKTILPSEPYQEGVLTARLQRETARARKLRAANDQPSALRLWGELGAVVPDAEQLGINLEELHLTRRGGRLQAKVPAAEGNPLRNASLVESSINRSPAVAARGEFERRDSQIAMRVQLDYRPKADAGGAP